MPDTAGYVFTCKVRKPGKPSPERLPIDVSDRILEWTVDEHDAKTDKLTLEMDNRDLKILDDKMISKGNWLTVTWGYLGNMAVPRTFVVQKVKGGLKLTIEAYAKSILMNKDRRSRSWKGMKRSEVAREIAEEWGFDGNHQLIIGTDRTFDVICQKNLTDAQFLKYLADREAYQFYIDSVGIHFEPRLMGKPPTRVLWYYTDPGAGDMLDFPTLDTDVTARPGGVKQVGIDPLTRKPFEAKAGNKDTKREGLSPQVEVEEYDPITREGKRVMRPAAPKAEETAVGARDAGEAKKKADSAFVKSARLTVKMAVPIYGDPQMHPKQVCEMRNIGKALSGNYFVRGAKHDGGREKGYKVTLTVVTDGPRFHGAAKSGAKVNTSKTNEKGADKPKALTPVQEIDPVTREPTGRTIYQ